MDISSNLKPTAFFVDIELSEFDNLIKILDAYKISKYLIAHETHNKKGQKKPHYHILGFMSPTTYKNLISKLIRDYKLKGEGRGGKRFYGKITKPIRDLQKMASYSLKDGNFRYKGYTEEEIKQYFAQSYKAETKISQIHKMYIELDKKFEYKQKIHIEIGKGYKCETPELMNEVMREIIHYKIDHEQPFTANQLKNQTYKYFQWTKLFHRNIQLAVLEYNNKWW